MTTFTQPEIVKKKQDVASAAENSRSHIVGHVRLAILGKVYCV